MLKPIFRKMRTPANASCAQSSVVSSPHSTLCLTQVPVSIYTRSESSCGLCSMPQRSPCIQQHLGKHPALWKQLWFPPVLGVSNLLQGVCRLLPLWWLGSTAFQHTTSSSPTYLTLLPTVCGSAVLILLFLSQLAGVAADVCADLWVFPLFQLLS